MVCHIEVEKIADKNLLINMEVFKSTSRNAIKYLKMRQEMHKATKNGKTTEATLKQIANQEF